MKKDTKKAQDKKKAGRKTGVKSWVKVKKYMYEQKSQLLVGGRSNFGSVSGL